eukprot:gene573-619_t
MQSVDDLQTQLASKEHEFMFKLKDLEQAYINTLNERDSEKKSLEKIISLKEKEINTIQAQVNQYKKTSEKSERDLAEARSSCILLTSSLKRLEEERRLGLIHEQCLEGEVLSLKATIEKLGEDVEKGRRTIQEIENNQRLLVDHTVVEKHLETIQKLQEEAKKIEASHRALIQRYSTLKSALDSAYGRTTNLPSARASMGFFVASPSSASAPAQSFPMATGNVHPSAGHGSAAMEPLSVTVDGTSGIVAASSGPAKATVKKRRGAHVSIDGFWKVAEDLKVDPTAPPAAPLIRRSLTVTPKGSNAMTETGNLLPAGEDEWLELLERDGRPRRVVEALIDEVHALRAQLEAGGGGTGRGGKVDGELGSFTSAYTHFEGLGHGQNVPSYLRATGMIRNQMLTRAQASALVSAIWTAKKERDKDMAKISAPAISLADILEQYFLGVFESKNTALETAYSFMSVLKSTETATAGWTEGRMFKLVLDGTLHED